MLKKSLFSPAQPRRAETRLFPCFVLASLRGSTYRTWETSCLGSSGWAGEECYASPLRSLRPCWTGFLSIPRSVFLLSKRYRPFKVRRAHRVFRSLLGVCQASVSLRSFGDARPQDKSGLIMSGDREGFGGRWHGECRWLSECRSGDGGCR
jgi:hypothetical protein